jgi:hypothetical protein
MPSAKYSCSGSPLILAKGSTAIDGLSGSESVALIGDPLGVLLAAGGADAEDHRDRDVRCGRDTKLVVARNRWFESISLERRANKLSVPLAISARVTQ